MTKFSIFCKETDTFYISIKLNVTGSRYTKTNGFLRLFQIIIYVTFNSGVTDDDIIFIK